MFVKLSWLTARSFVDDAVMFGVWSDWEEEVEDISCVSRFFRGTFELILCETVL